MSRTGRMFVPLAAVAMVCTFLTAARPAVQFAGDHVPLMPAGRSSMVTLITGDIARLTVAADGRRSAELLPRGSTAAQPYVTSERDGDVHLIPAQAMPYLSSGQLDERLFNLTELVRQGYDEPHEVPPLLLTAAGGDRLATTASRSAVARRRDLPSVGAQAVTPRHGRAFWEAIDDDSRGDRPRLDGGIGKVWLDGKVEVELEQSVPQIGAPAAWRAGYDGRGVKVAVLDTGYDPDHPDLAGRVTDSAGFVPGADVRDGHGHGTHVASTIGGSGGASDGRRTGVAPQAELIIGKVLNDAGSAQESWIIAGMEWAVSRGARVVNMSLGGGPSDGSDAMSQAVNTLSQRTGTLFVIAAGNAGPNERTVSAPGAATAALTVGAVNRDDELARFSSRGPRLGDGAVKPEVTAPGVDIVAARALGTTLGRAVDRWYTTAGGTSMATPHVAGAAAILAQRHPDWTGQQLKAVLAATATPTADIPAAAGGTGRVDVPSALRADVVPHTAAVNFGQLGWTESPPAPVTRTVSYTNTSGHAVELDLSLGVASPAGHRPALMLSTRTVRIPAGGTGAVTLTLDQAHTDAGDYAGVLTARGAGRALRTAIGFTAGGPLHKLTVSAVNRSGTPALPFGGVQVWNLDTGKLYSGAFDFGSGSRTIELPSGRYAVMVSVIEFDNGPFSSPDAISMLGDPELAIRSDVHLRYDARTAAPVTIAVPRRADPTSFLVAWRRTVGDREAAYGWYLGANQADRMFFGSFERPRTGTFEVAHRWDFSEPTITVDVEGPDGFRMPTPRQVLQTPAFIGSARMRLVDGGTGTAEELAAVDAAGAAVLIRQTGFQNAGNQARAVAAAGGRLMLMHRTAPGYWLDAAPGSAIPAHAMELPTATRLRAAMAAGNGTVSIQVEGTAQSRYRYDLFWNETRLATPVVHRLSERDLAMERVRFHRRAAADIAGQIENRSAFWPGSPDGMPLSRSVTAPLDRTDYLTPGVEWTSSTIGDARQLPWSGVETSLPRTYRAGEQVDRLWWPALLRPAVPPISGLEDDGMPVTRVGDHVRVAVPPFVSGDSQIYGWADDPDDQVELKLSRDGVEIGRAHSSRAGFTVPPAAGWYDLTLSVRRAPSTWALTSTASQTHWRFRSARADDERSTALGLIQVDIDLPTDRHNALPADRPGSAVLTPGYQPGYRGSGGFGVGVAVSYDGEGWQQVPIKPGKHGSFIATLPPPAAGATTAALRVTATDNAGNQLTQTIEQAWLVR